jgi:hypothetical protein
MFRIIDTTSSGMAKQQIQQHQQQQADPLGVFGEGNSKLKTLLSTLESKSEEKKNNQTAQVYYIKPPEYPNPDEL